MTPKTIFGLLVASLCLALGLAACQAPASKPTSTLPLTSTASPVRPTATAQPPTASPILPTATARPPTPTATSLPPTPRPSAEVIVKQMNLRTGPGTVYPVVALLKQGDVLTVVGRSPDRTWLSVKTAGNVAGWCSASSRYVRLSVEVGTLAVAAVPLPPATSPTAAPAAAPTATP